MKKRDYLRSPGIDGGVTKMFQKETVQTWTGFIHLNTTSNGEFL
jgi:hypothetical protein